MSLISDLGQSNELNANSSVGGLSKKKAAELADKLESLKKDLKKASDLKSLKNNLNVQEKRLGIARKMGDTAMIRAIQEEINKIK